MAGEVRAREPERRAASCSASHGLFTWGDDGEGLLRDDARASSTRAIDWLDGEDRRQAGLRRRARRGRCRPAERRAVAARLMPAIRGLISAGRAARSAISTTRRRCWSSSTPRDCEPLAALGTSCPDHFLRTKIRPLVVDFDPATPTSTRRSPACRRRSRPTARTTPPTTSAASTPTARRMRDPNPVVYLVPGVGMLTFATRQGDGAHRRRVLRQRHQRHARRRRPSRRYRRPARAGGLRHRVLAARGGQAAAHAEAEEPRRAHRLVTGGAGGIGRATAGACCARAPASCSPTSTPAALDEAGAGARRARYGTDMRARASRWT